MVSQTNPALVVFSLSMMTLVVSTGLENRCALLLNAVAIAGCALSVALAARRAGGASDDSRTP